MAPSSREWSTLGADFSPWILEAVDALGFTTMTPVQAAVIPLFSGNKDVVVEAVTGSGKTLAFLLPILNRISKLSDPIRTGRMFGIILAPTRELAEQIQTVLKQLIDFGPKTPNGKPEIRSQLIIGGSVTAHADLSLFLKNNPHLLVATPGRLLELLASDHVKCSSLEVLVFDEADRLLDLGFEVTISKILAYMPKQKRAGLFSATISDAVSKLAKMGLRNPVKVSVGSGKPNQGTPSTLDLRHIALDPKNKMPLLLHLLSSESFKRGIVYFPTSTTVNYFYTLLTFLSDAIDNVPHFYSLHGKLPPGPRRSTLRKFTEDLQKSVLLTTDVAARGLDIPEVELVIQYDPPSDPSMFTHRAGRTARAGNEGRAILFLHKGREEDYVEFLRVRKNATKPLHITTKDEKRMEKLQQNQRIRQWMLEDRARHDLAVRAFLSYVRFYAKHTATSIFRISSLDLTEIAKSYHLLRLPKMPELKTVENLPAGGWLGEEVDFNNYSYQNPQQELARIESLKKEKRDISTNKKSSKTNNAWSGKAERRELAAERREKRKKKQIAIKSAQLEEKGNESQDSDDEIQVDWKEQIQQKKRKKNESSVAGFDGL